MGRLFIAHILITKCHLLVCPVVSVFSFSSHKTRSIYTYVYMYAFIYIYIYIYIYVYMCVYIYIDVQTCTNRMDKRDCLVSFFFSVVYVAATCPLLILSLSFSVHLTRFINHGGHLFGGLLPR